MPLFDSAAPQPLPNELRWHYVKIKPGEALYGYVAGKMVGVWVHWLGGSKPCRAKMTQRTLPCPHCTEEGPRLRWLGYLPLWDRSGRRVVVAISNTVGPAVELLVYAQPVRLARTNGARDPLRIETPEPHMDMRLAERLFRDGPHDLTPWLLHLWADRELASWLKARTGVAGSGEHKPDSPTSSTSPATASPAKQLVGVADLEDGRHLILSGDVATVKESLKRHNADLRSLATVPPVNHVPQAKASDPAPPPKPKRPRKPPAKGKGGKGPVRRK